MSLAPEALQNQGSPEWLEARKHTFNASECGALMGCNPWFPRNCEELAQQKYHGVQPDIFPTQRSAMDEGLAQEPFIRSYVEERCGVIFEPVVVTLDSDPRFRASLDGISMDGEVILEIKNSKATYEKKKIPDHYYYQIQHQFLVSGATRCIFAVRNPETEQIKMTEVFPSEDDMARLRQAWIDFEAKFKDAELPETERDDVEWEIPASRLREIAERKKELEAEEKELKEILKGLAGGAKCKGFGVTVYPTKRTSVDWKRIEKDFNIDTTPYIKESESWTVRVG